MMITTFLPRRPTLACLTALIMSCTSSSNDPAPPTETADPADPGTGHGSDSGAGYGDDAGSGAENEDEDVNIDPSGDWDLTYWFSAGCGQPASTTDGTFTVTSTAHGFEVAAEGATTRVTLLCTPKRCILSGIFAWSSRAGDYQQHAILQLDANDRVSGSGTETIATPTGTCLFTFTVGGSRN